MNQCMNESKNPWTHAWTNEWMNGWLNEWLKKWMNEWMNDWMNEWTNEWMNEWTNEWMNEWMNRWMKKWIGEWINEKRRHPKINESLIHCMKVWMKEWLTEGINAWMNRGINEWMNAWMNESINEWMNESINEWMNESMNDWIIEFWRMSRTKASLAHLPLQNLRDVAHKSLVFTSSTFNFWGMSRTKARFSHLQPSDDWRISRPKASFSHLTLSDFEGCLARKLRFHNFNFHFLRDVSHEMRFCEIANARHAIFWRTNGVSVSDDVWGSSRASTETAIVHSRTKQEPSVQVHGRTGAGAYAPWHPIQIHAVALVARSLPRSALPEYFFHQEVHVLLYLGWGQPLCQSGWRQPLSCPAPLAGGTWLSGWVAAPATLVGKL